MFSYLKKFKRASMGIVLLLCLSLGTLWALSDFATPWGYDTATAIASKKKDNKKKNKGGIKINPPKLQGGGGLAALDKPAKSKKSDNSLKAAQKSNRSVIGEYWEGAKYGVLKAANDLSKKTGFNKTGVGKWLDKATENQKNAYSKAKSRSKKHKDEAKEAQKEAQDEHNKLFANKKSKDGKASSKDEDKAASEAGKSNGTNSNTNGGEKKAKSKEEKNPKKGKKTPTYSGGTKQGVNKDPIERQYVKDDRRSPTDAIRFMSADPATAALMENVMGKINATVGGKYLVVYSSDGMFSFSSKIYKPLTDKEKDYIMEVALKTVKESRLPKKVGAKVSAFIAEQDKGRAAAIQALNSDVSSELSTGYAWFKPFASPISTALGFLAIIIFVFFTASITFDVAYLTIGLVRQFLDNSSEGRPRFVTGEAMETAKEVDGYVQSGSYRAYVAVYFRRRMGIFFLTSILLIWLISGQIYEMFTWAFEIFEEIFNIRG